MELAIFDSNGNEVDLESAFYLLDTLKRSGSKRFIENLKSVYNFCDTVASTIYLRWFEIRTYGDDS